VKNWPWLIASLYAVIIIALTLPVTIISFWPYEETLNQNLGEMAISYVHWWQFWVWLAVMVAAQFALLAVPAKVVNKRPVTHRTIWLPVVASALMMGGLAAGLFLSVAETITQDSLGHFMWWSALGIMVFTWVLWGSIFRRWSNKVEPRNAIEKQCRCLFRGSILELLVAIPTHIVARYRGYCCAGFATFVGIAIGLAVMLFSFGPSVFYLYVERWRRLRPKKGLSK